MDPQAWGDGIIDFLERQAIISALVHRDADDGGDRYQPNHVHATYCWCGPRSAATEVMFRIKTSDHRPALDRRTSLGWHVQGLPAPSSWGPEWEQIRIRIPSTSQPVAQPSRQSDELHEIGRFRLRLSVVDTYDPQVEATTRTIELSNLREQGGILHSVRILELELPELLPVRVFGLDEDKFYRSGGLLGFLDEGQRCLSFKPWALLPEPVRRPVAGPTLQDAVAQGILSAAAAQLLRESRFERLHKFQADSIEELRRCLASSSAAAVVLTSGTAAGKTEAFFVPILELLEKDEPAHGVRALLVYPMKALGADQARRFFGYLARANASRRHPITLGIFDGDTPSKHEDIVADERAGRLRTPFSRCPVSECAGEVRFALNKAGSALQAPTCMACGTSFPWLRVSKTAIKETPPQILLTTPDTVHRQVSSKFAWMGHTLFGGATHVCSACGKYTPASTKTIKGEKPCSCGRALEPAESNCPRLVVFDEAHLYKGAFGSQVALLIARLRRLAQRYGHHPVLVCASATIAAPSDFGRQLFGGPVTLIEGEEERPKDQESTRFHLFLMPIQVTVLNAVGSVLAGCLREDHARNERNRVLVFSDSKRTVYQLEATLPEFFATAADNTLPADVAEPPTRSHTGDLGPLDRRIVEAEFDRGEVRVLLATQTLEVGVDFSQLPLEIQTGATYSYNDYIQRVGRAGRRGFPALVICILRPHIPLDYYYYEHCRELVQFAPETLDDVPLRSDNPFFVEKHVPAAIQDYLIAAQPGCQLVWKRREAVALLETEKDKLRAYLKTVFLRSHSWDKDLLTDAIDRGIEAVHGILAGADGPNNTSDRLSEHIKLDLRASDRQVEIASHDFEEHEGISLAGELLATSDDEDDEPDPGGAEPDHVPETE